MVTVEEPDLLRSELHHEIETEHPPDHRYVTLLLGRRHARGAQNSTPGDPRRRRPRFCQSQIDLVITPRIIVDAAVRPVPLDIRVRVQHGKKPADPLQCCRALSAPTNKEVPLCENAVSL